ncbi:MAG TPA: ATP-binding protein [Vicinamibacterales bacterium]|jgi:two-component system nitrogen regulation sensor histidine kinase NtrY|nr:ATP-binding protein [Vicinamibacterales bacterium]
MARTPATVTSMPPRRPPPRKPVEPQRARRPFRDNPRLILVGIALLAIVLLSALALTNRSSALSPSFLTEFVLYALSAADLTMLVALAFVLARNVVKLVVERRDALPFARFRSKLVALLLIMTLVPSVLVLLIGSELIRTNIDQWFNAPMDEILTDANQIAGDYYHERQLLASDHAARIAKSLGSVDLNSRDVTPIRTLIAPDVTVQRVKIVEVYRVNAGGSGLPSFEPVVDVASPDLPIGYSRAASDRLAEQTLRGEGDARSIETLGTIGDFLHAAAIVRGREGRVTGVVVATDYLTGDFAARARRMTQAFESYNQLRVLKRPMTGLYLSIFLMVTLLILFGATWMGSYFAKRITQPVLRLEAAAREIGAGRFDQRLEPQTHDEFGTLTEAFNAMAGELAVSRRKVDRSTLELERKHQEVEGRRRYIETVLERIATGVVSIDAAGAVMTINTAAARLLSLDRSIIGQPAQSVFERADLQPIAALVNDASHAKPDPAPQEIAIVRDGHEVHLAVAATVLTGDAASEGLVLVLDDVTPLIRAQKVAAWREVARRLAHEIKNPLTPIQLSADRIRRHMSSASGESRAVIDECTSTIVGEVESLKGLVDEFSQFARMPSPRTVPTDVKLLIDETLALYNGIFADVQITQHFGDGIPLVQLDPEQIRRVLINLIDNAVEAMERRGHIAVEAERDEANSLVRVIVADNGPGIPAGEREKLFLPYYSTKRRGSGLGLAIVRRIIAEHGGAIDVSDNMPRGTRFTIELPC